MGRNKSSEGDEPELHDSADCLREIVRCASEIKNIEQEEADWISSNHGGKWPGTSLGIRKWEARKAMAEARFDELNKTRPSPHPILSEHRRECKMKRYCWLFLTLGSLFSSTGLCQDSKTVDLAGRQLTIGMPQHDVLEMIAAKGITTEPKLSPPLPKDLKDLDFLMLRTGRLYFTDGLLSNVHKIVGEVAKNEDTSSLFELLYTLLSKLDGQRGSVTTETRRDPRWVSDKIRVVGTTGTVGSTVSPLHTIQPTYVIELTTGFGTAQWLGNFIEISEQTDRSK